jgi:ABC-2 type transport system permease protein/lipopolysaccharide transport system permease protein
MSVESGFLRGGSAATNSLRCQRLVIDQRPGNRWRLAKEDVVAGLAHWRIWLVLGWSDVLQRYRRSVLGPFWLTASMGIMVVSLGLLYATLFNVEVAEFMPFVCVGILVWGFISSMLVEAGTLFTANELFIKQIRLPFSIYVWRFVWARVIIFAHNFLIYIGVVLYFRQAVWPQALLAAPALVILILNGFFASLCLGMISSRFRDVPQIIAAAVQVIFFITPVLWKPELLSGHRYVADWNPFYHLIEILRAPLLGQLPSGETIAVVCGLTVANAAVALAMFIRFRTRIAYWV